jgi:hypothetical protein
MAMRIWLGYERGRELAGAQRSRTVGPLVPAGPDDLAPHYDLTLSLPNPAHVAFAAFGRWLAEAADAHGLSCAVLHDGTVYEAVRRLADGRLTVGFHLDSVALWHRPDDPYARLAQAVADAGGCPVNPPARSQMFTDKAAAHAELVRCGLGVPATVVIRPWTPDRPLTAAERACLRLDEPGARVHIQPANGFGNRGVVRVEKADPEGLAAAVAAARSHDRHDTYLAQRAVCCPRLECSDLVSRPACWRVLYCLGELIPFWWTRPGDGDGPSSRLMTREEIRCHRLRPVLAYAAALARLSGLEWFSTELCLTAGPEPSRYRVPGSGGRDWAVVAIDCVNDPCDGDVQSRWPGGTPDAVVRHVAGRFAEAAWLCRHTSIPARAGEPLRRTA